MGPLVLFIVQYLVLWVTPQPHPLCDVLMMIALFEKQMFVLQLI